MSEIKNKLKMLIIGSSVLDEIEYPDRVEHKPGGIFYTMLCLSNIKAEFDIIDLITNYDHKTVSLFQPAFSNCSMHYSNEVDSINSVKLNVSLDGKRTETFCSHARSFTLDSTLEYQSYDGILINMITGKDITIDQLKHIRNKFTGIIYLDIHTLARGFNSQNERAHRIIPDIEKWLENIDIVQVNTEELQTLSDLEEEMEIVEHVIEMGCKAIIITKAEKGATIFYRQDGEMQRVSVKAMNVNSVNFVGCGDIFGAVFFYSYINSKNYSDSLYLANIAAGKSTEFTEIDDYKKLKNIFYRND